MFKKIVKVLGLILFGWIVSYAFVYIPVLLNPPECGQYGCPFSGGFPLNFYIETGDAGVIIDWPSSVIDILFWSICLYALIFIFKKLKLNKSVDTKK